MSLLASDRQTEVEAIWFNVPAQQLDLKTGQSGSFYYQLKVNRFRGAETAQLVIEQFQ